MPAAGHGAGRGRNETWRFLGFDAMTNRGKRWYGGTSGIAITVAAGMMLHAAPAFAQTTGGQVVAGQATISGQGTAQTTITQTSDRAIVNWDRFSLGAGDMALFQQPDARSITVNRVTGGEPSTILGSIKANGQVVLINRNGVLFGKGSQVDTAGLIVSTHDIDAAGFMRGDSLLRFDDGGNDKAEIVVEGRITIRDAGMAAFVAPHVRNSGLILADMGRVSLAAGKGFGIDLYGDGLVRFAASDAITGTLRDANGQPVKALVENDGTIAAQGGKILLSASAARDVVNASVNVTGIVRADSVSSQGGVITLSGPGGVTTETGSVISAAGATGGSVTVAGGGVGLGGLVDASSTGWRQNGGTVSVQAGGMLSLGGATIATATQGSGGSVTYRAQRLLENGDAITNVSGLIDGGTIRSLIDGVTFSSGTYLADGVYGRGGRVDMTAMDLRLLTTSISATGRGGGGLVRLGGAFQGGKVLDTTQPYYDAFAGRWGELPTLANAGQTFVNDGTRVDVRASRGQGGTAVVWSDARTTFLGAIDARGSGASGSGGAVELSSAQELRSSELDRVSVGGGHLLLDPKNIIIGSSNDYPAWSYQGIIGRFYGYPTVAELEVQDQFGYSLALNANNTLLAVGAPGDDGYNNQWSNGTAGAYGANGTGAVYLFSFTNSNFSGGVLQGIMGRGYTGVKNVNVAGLDAGDQFGSSVALNAAGDRMAVAAIMDAGAANNRFGTGAVYLFSFSDTSFSGGTLQATIGDGYTSSTGAKNVSVANLATPSSSMSQYGNFGSGVSLNAAGNLLAVGAWSDQGPQFDAPSGMGGAYLFTFTDNNFSGGSLKSIVGRGYTGANDINISRLDFNRRFGTSVALNGSGNRLAVGSFGDYGGGSSQVTGRGAVYLISFADQSFSGGSVTGIIGNDYTGSGNGTSSSKDVNISLAQDQYLGRAVSFNAIGDRLAVGSWVNTAFLFSFSDGNFSNGALTATIGSGNRGVPNLFVNGISGRFASALALNGTGDRLAIGDPQGSGSNGMTSASGGAYLFSFSDSNFSGATLLSTLGRGYNAGKDLDVGPIGSGAAFGYSPSLNSDATRLAIGAIGDTGLSGTTPNAGAVYLFSFSDTNFSGGTLQAVIGNGYTGGKNYNTSGAAAGNQFGVGVSLNASGNRLAVGALTDDGQSPTSTSSDYGAVYLFSFTDTSFSGASLAGVIGKGYSGGNSRNVANLEPGDQFGASVSLNAAGDRLAVGAVNDAGQGNASSQSGAAYLFTFTDTSFSGGTLQAILGKGYTDSSGKYFDLARLDANDWFGRSVSLNAAGDRLAVGANRDGGAGNTAVDIGAVYLFGFSDTSFSGASLRGVIGKGYGSGSGSASLDVSNLDANDRFGTAISLNAVGDRLAVGAHFDDGFNNAGNNTGAVYIFDFTDGSFSGGALRSIIGSGYDGGGNLPVISLDNDDYFGRGVAFNAAGDRLAVGADGDGGPTNLATGAGAVYLFSAVAASALPTAYGSNAASTITIKASDIAAQLAAGTSVTLQASNDITVNTAIAAATANTSLLTLQAGRSLAINANVTTNGGGLSLIANDRLANGVVDAQRDSGAAAITMAAGTAINAGAGAVSIALRDGAGLTNSTSGAITLTSITGGTISAVNQGPTSGSGIVLASGANLTATGTGANAIVLAAQKFTNNGGASALTATNGNWQIWSTSPTNDTVGGLNYGFKQYGATYGTSAVSGFGNGLFYSVSVPSLNVSGTMGAGTKVYDGTTSATFTAGTLTCPGCTSPYDTITGVYGGLGTYDTKDVGTNKTITANSFIFLDGNGKRLYGYATPGANGFQNTSSSITVAPLTITGGAGVGTYRRSAMTNFYTTTGLFAGDSVSAVTGSASGITVGTYADNLSGATGTGLSNYAITYVNGSLTINPKRINVFSPTATSRTYDGTTVVALGGTLQSSAAGSSFGRVVTGDSVTLVGVGNFADKNVGTGKAITANYSLSGADASNYVINFQPTYLTADVTQAALTVTGVTGNKVYDATVNAPLSGATVTPFGSDVVVLNGSGVTGTYADKNVGANKAVTLSGSYAISGADAANYTLTQPSGVTGTITPANLAVTGVTVATKAYDGSTSATVSGGSVTALSGDSVSLSTSGATAHFVNANAGTGKSVVTTGYTLSGSGAGNYTPVTIGLTGTVTPKALTITAPSIAAKTYDASTVAGTVTVGTLSGFVGSETVTATGTGALSSKDAGTRTANVSYTLADGTNGGLASNYTLANTLGVSALVNAKALTITAPSIAAKTYDATTTAGGVTIGTLSGFVGTETVTATGTAGALSSKDAGTRTATVRYALADGTNGGLATNYTLADTTGVSALVNQAPLTITANNASKTYNGLGYSGGNGVTYASFVGGETAAVLGGTLSYTGTSQSAVNAGSYVITPRGLTSSNYAITFANGALTVNRAPLTIEYAPYGYSSVYGSPLATLDGEVNVTGFVNGETVARLGGRITWTTTATPSSPVGSYRVTGSGLTSNNYAITETQASWAGTAYNIYKASLTVTANSASKVYDGRAWSGGNGVTYTGFVNGDTAASLGGTLTYGGDAQGKINAGGYDIMPAGLTSNNYRFTFVSGPLEISRAALSLTYTANAATSTYGSARGSVSGTVTGTGFVNGETVANLGGAATWTTSVTAMSDAGSYAINGSGLNAGNYTIAASQASGNATAYTVARAPLTITANSASKAYDGVAYSGGTGVTYAGFVNSQNSSALGGTLSYSGTSQNAVNTGSYVITPGGLTSSNYAITFVDGTLTIGKAAVALVYTANAATSTYGASLASLGGTVSGTGFVNGETVANLSGALSWATTATPTSVVGSYSVTGSGLTSDNYTITASQAAVNSSAYTVTRAALTVAANAASKTYDGLAYSGGNGVTYTGFVNGENASVLGGMLGYGGSSQGAINAGNYVITPRGLTSSNYAISFADGALTVGKAALSLLYTANAATSIYGASPATLNGTVSGTGFVNGETLANLAGAANWTTLVDARSSVGSHGILGSGLTSDNYTITANQAGANSTAYTVTKAALTVTANDASKTYDGQSYSGGNGVIYSGFVNGETSAVLGGALGYSGTSQLAKNAGSYVITPDGLTSGNYAVNFVSGALTIAQKALTLTGVLTAQDKTYDGDNVAAFGTSGLQLSGVVSGETVNLDWTGVTGRFASPNVARDASGNVIAQAVTLSGAGALSGAAGVIANYSYSAIAPTATATITPKALSIGGSFSASNKDYDGTTAAVIDTRGLSLAGKVGSDDVSLNIAGATGSFASKDVARDANGNVIAQTVTLSTSGSLSGSARDNYSFAAGAPTVTATINPAALSLLYTANAARSTYGASPANVSGTVTGSGFVHNETIASLAGAVAWTTPVTATSGAGSHAIIGSGLTSGNYAITANQAAVNATAYTVDKAALTVTANAASKSYDGLAWSGGNGVTYSGLVNGETSAVLGGGLTYGGSAQGAVNAGSYVIAPSGLTSNNYETTFVDGALTVNRAALSLMYAANAASSTYGSARATLSGTVTGTGFVNGETVANLGSAAVWTTPVTALSGAGRYAIAGSGLTSDNYTITASQAAGNTTAYTVNQAALTVTANAASKTYDGQAWSGGNGVTYSGFVNSETASVLGGALGYGGSAQNAVNAGGYAITPNGLTSGNYTINFVSGALTIAQKALMLTGALTAQDKTYDGGTGAMIDTSGLALSGVVSGETVNLDWAGVTGRFASPNVARDANGNVIAQAVTLSGAGALSGAAGVVANYSYSAIAPTATATITPKALSIGGSFSASNKDYDGTAAAVIDTRGLSLAGKVGSDDVSLNIAGATGSFASKDVARDANGNVIAQTVTLSTSGSLSGSARDNYSFAAGAPTVTATINPAALSLLYTANAARSTYGASPANVSGTVTGSGFVHNETIASLAGAVAWTTPVTATSGAGSHAVTGSGLTSGNYAITANQAAANATAYTVDKAALTVTAISASKTYDGQAWSGGNGVTYTGFVNGETSAVLGGALGYGGTSQNAVNAGRYILTPGGLTASNYAITFVDGMLTIDRRLVNPAGNLVAFDKSYDGSTNAMIDTSGVQLSGVVVGDQVSLDLAGATGQFADRHASATAKLVTLSNIGSLTGTAKDNYILGTAVPSTTAFIRPRALTIGTPQIAAKTYDATTVAGTVTAGGLDGVVSGEALRVSAIAGPLSNKDVGSRVARVSYTLADTATGLASDYSLADGVATVQVTPAALQVTGGFTAASRVYDATTVAAISTTGLSLSGIVGADTVGLKSTGATGAFADKNVGVAKTVTLSASGLLAGQDAGNYVLSAGAPTALADVTPAMLGVTGGFTASSRIYDATTDAAISTAGLGLNGILGLDIVALKTSGATGQFADKNVSANKTVFLSASGILSGMDASNYVLAPTAPTANADITRASLSVTGVRALDRMYDATNVAGLSGGSVAAFAGDMVQLSTANAVGAFSDKNVGTAKPVTASGYTLTGADAGNYALVQPSGLSASISRATLMVSDMTIANKVYDAGLSATLAGGSVRPLGQDDVRLNMAGADARFDTKNVGSGKAVSVRGLALLGADAGNYTLVAPTGVTGTITPAQLQVTGIGTENRSYDTTTLVRLDGGSIVPLASDVVRLDGSRAIGVMADKNVGAGKLVTVSGYQIAGADAANYTLVQPQGLTVTITPAQVLVTGASALSKTYDGSSTTTLSGGVITALAPDVVFLVTSGAVARFADKSVGADKAVTVTGYTLGGADAANYSVIQPTGLTASITRLVSVSWTGGGDGKSWFDPGNWAGGAIPDGANVAEVTLAPNSAVTFDGDGTVAIDRLITTPDTDTVPNSTDTALTLLKGNLVIANDLSVDTFVQRGGTLTGTGTVKVLDGFIQSGGAIAMTGDVSIHQGAGDLETLSVSGRDIVLTGDQTVRSGGTVASRDLTIVAGGDVRLGGPTIVGRNMSLTAGRNGTGAISQDRYVTVAGDAIMNAAGSITLTSSGNHFGGMVSCTSAAGSISGSCTSGGAIDQLRRDADQLAGRLAAVSSASGGAVGTLNGLPSPGATSPFTGGPASANAPLAAGAPEFQAMPLGTSDNGAGGSAGLGGNGGASLLLAVAPTTVETSSGSGRMLAGMASTTVGGSGSTYVTARFDEDRSDAVYRRIMPKTNLGSSVIYVGN